MKKRKWKIIGWRTTPVDIFLAFATTVAIIAHLIALYALVMGVLR